MYYFNSRVRYSELDHQTESLSCSSIINYFQDCSTFQSEDLNHGLSYLQSKNRLWLMNSWQLQILDPARLGDYITIGTWAYDFKGFYGYRNFILKDHKDTMLAVANSIWVYMDTETGRPVKIPEDYATTSGYGMEPPYPMEYTDRKVDIPADCTPLAPFTVIKSNIDSYNHVNNGQYIKMAEEFLPSGFSIGSMRVEYKKQAVLGTSIIPMISEVENAFTVVLADINYKPYAVVQFHH
jgi:acyl-ACP thioesterase